MDKAWSRLFGFAAIAAGAGTAAFWLIHPPPDEVGRMGERGWVVGDAMFIGIVLLLQVALVGVGVSAGRSLGAVARVGLVVAFLGSGMFVGAGVWSAFVAPVLQGSQPALIAMDGALLGRALGKYFALTGLLFGVGYAMWALALSRRRAIPKTWLIAIAVSAPVLGLSPLVPHWLRVAACVVFGVAHLLLGAWLWRALLEGPSRGA